MRGERVVRKRTNDCERCGITKHSALDGGQAAAPNDNGGIVLLAGRQHGRAGVAFCKMALVLTSAFRGFLVVLLKGVRGL